MPGLHTFYDGSKLLEPFADMIGMECDKINLVFSQIIIYICALIFYNKMNLSQVSLRTRTIFPFIVGISICYFCYGSAIKHPMALAMVNYIIFRFAPDNHVHKITFVFSMGYLFFLHWYKFYVLTSYSIDVTGTMMVIVQKCTTLAFSLHDGRVKKPEQLNEIQKKEAIKTPPPLMLYLSYMFMYQTVMTGPLCFYTDYKKFIEGDHLKINNGKIPTPHKSALSKLFMTIIFMTIILTMGQITPESIASSEYMAMPFLKWAAYWFIAIFVCRVQYYYVWVTADAVANVSGFGFNGYEENGNEKWDLITNVHPIKVEMAQSFKETLDNWNCTTMYWLRRVAYDRVPKNMRTVSTYLLSALWHGFFPGYYITFTGGALLTLAFRTTRRCLRWRFVGSKVQKQVYDVVSFASTKVCLAYITMPFVTMHLNPGWFLYKQVYFCVHIAALAAIFILPLIFPAEKKVVPEKEANLQKNK